jgi:hypothetical protein
MSKLFFEREREALPSDSEVLAVKVLAGVRTSTSLTLGEEATR